MELNPLCRDISRLTLWSAVMGVNLHPQFLSRFILLFCMCNLLFVCLCARLVDATVRILCAFISALTYRLLSNIPIVVELYPLCQYLLVLPCPCVADEMVEWRWVHVVYEVYSDGGQTVSVWWDKEEVKATYSGYQYYHYFLFIAIKVIPFFTHCKKVHFLFCFAFSGQMSNH